jgi:hypothetical protein
VRFFTFWWFEVVCKRCVLFFWSDVEWGDGGGGDDTASATGSR